MGICISGVLGSGKPFAIKGGQIVRRVPLFNADERFQAVQAPLGRIIDCTVTVAGTPTKTCVGSVSGAAVGACVAGPMGALLGGLFLGSNSRPEKPSRAVITFDDGTAAEIEIDAEELSSIKAAGLLPRSAPQEEPAVEIRVLDECEKDRARIMASLGWLLCVLVAILAMWTLKPSGTVITTLTGTPDALQSQERLVLIGSQVFMGLVALCAGWRCISNEIKRHQQFAQITR